MTKANPVLVELTRGDVVESSHRGAAVVANAAGEVVAAWGEAAHAIYPRSAVKPLQALPLIESGAAERFRLSDEEIALACASHSGEPEHCALVSRWLRRIGLDVGALACGAHAPLGEQAAIKLLCAGEKPTAVHNNCSGKHAGLLTTALHLGEPTAGYIGPDHPVQRRLAEVLGAMGGADLGAAPRGTDGCGIPTIAMPLMAMAQAMAKLAAPEGLEPARRAACRRVVSAMTGHPYLVAGRDRFDTVVIEAAAGALITKAGAEGVYAAALPGRGLGMALKIDDGAKRAAEVATAALLVRFGDLADPVRSLLAARAEHAITNAAGEAVGVTRPAPGWPN